MTSINRISDAELSIQIFTTPQSTTLGKFNIHNNNDTKEPIPIPIKVLQTQSFTNKFANSVDSYLSSILLMVCRISGVAKVNMPIMVGIQNSDTISPILFRMGISQKY